MASTGNQNNGVRLPSLGNRVAHQDARETPHASESVQPQDAEEEDVHEHIMVDSKQIERNAVRRELGFLMTAEKKRQLNEFVEKTIKCRQCSTYIPSEVPQQKPLDSRGQSTERPPCGCGHTYQWHVDRGCAGTDVTLNASWRSAGEKWKQSEHTKDIVNQSYGQVCFLGFNGGDSRYLAPYVRISCDTSPKAVWQLVSRHWDLPPPQLLLSITGGAKRFFNKDRDTHIFKKELIDAVKATGAWVLTGGLGTGVMQYVGQAVSEYAASVGSAERHKLVLIGVCPWGAVDGQELLTREEGGGLFPARYDAAQLCGPAAASKCAPLDNNHTHFILVDDGSVNQYGTEIAWRAKFEKYIASHIKTGIDREQSINVPVVQLLVNGGPGTLETASQAVSNGTPLIVIDGTKRAAELLAEAYRLTKDINQWTDKAERNFLGKIIPIMQRTLNSWKNEEQQQLLTIIKRRNLVTVFKLESLFGENTLDRIILQALMKTNRADPKAQLSLALAWNKPDFARTEILTATFDYKSLGGGRLYDPLLYALINDQHQFVQLFLDCGIDLQGFLTMERIDKLYREVLNPRVKDSRSELMHLLIDRRFSKKAASGPQQLAYIGEKLTDLIGSYYPNEYKGFLAMERNDESPCGALLRGDSNTKNCLSFPEKHLLLWAITVNRYEMALMFWRCGANHIGTALIASKLASELAKIAEDEGLDDVTDSYKRLTATFEELACAVLRECYDRNQHLTFLCLTRRIGSLGNTTALTIADDARHEVFMEHTSCQLKLSRIWKGNIALYTPEWKLALAAVFPFFVVPKLNFVRNRSSQPRLDEKEFDDLGQMPSSVSEAALGVGVNAASIVGGAAIHMNDNSAMTEGDDGAHQHSKYFSVNITGRGAHKISYVKALKYFFLAPVTKFIYNIISYLIFLILFSIFLLTELAPLDSTYSSVHPYEPLVWIWAASFILEEIRQIVSWHGKSIAYKLKKWWSNDWNKIDAAMYILLLVAIILRFRLPNSQFVYARMAYVVSESLFIIRSTQMFFVYKEIGPKIIMIGRMVRDVFFFFFILLVFLMSFGIAYRSLLYPNAALNGALLGNVVYTAYFIIFGQIPLGEVIGGPVESCNSTISSSQFEDGDACPQKNWLAGVYLAIYCLIANILLINLLIAMFSFTFQSIQGHSERLWKYNRYSLIYEFFNRPPIPCPFIVFSHLYRLGSFLFRCCSSCTDRLKKESDDFQVVLTDEETQRVISFERVAMECHMTRTTRQEKENITAKVSSTSQRIEKVLENIDDIKENLMHILSSVKDEHGRLGTSDIASASISLLASRDSEQLRQGLEARAEGMSPRVPDAAISRLKEDVGIIGDRLQTMEDAMRQTTETFNNRFDNVNQNFEVLGTKLAGLTKHIESLLNVDFKSNESLQVKEACSKCVAFGENSSLTPVNINENE